MMERRGSWLRSWTVSALMLLHASVNTVDAQGSSYHVQAVTKGTALLPCDITPPLANDSVILVIWYKNEQTPIYSYDVRGKHSEVASHWKDKEILEDRSYFRTITEPATLSLDNIEERDEGEYRCRVDFRKSPTRNSKVKLTVIVPPQKPKIINERGVEVSAFAGPYEEGAEMKLTCYVSGGRPMPRVRWWRDEMLLDAKDVMTTFPNLKQTQLIVARLERSDLHAKYTCQATNNNISQPVSATVTIEMYFKPLSASILSSNQPLSSDRKYEIVCQSVGSRPPAKITWYLDSKRLDDAVEKVSADGNVTISTLNFKPVMTDNDKALTCRAENTRVHSGVEEDTWKLNVFFVPMLHLQMGTSLNPEDIEEGDDVYFECKVRANPEAYKVIWKHNGQVVQHNQKSGVIMSSQALALQVVRRQQAGNYTCIASNVEGDGTSNTVELRVMYKPICRPDQKRVYGVAKHENAHVLCEVEAYPPPDSFKWSFNNTAETIDVPQARYRSPVHSLSTLTYTPMTEMDYGTVMCWASNTAGQQRDPCVFHIIAAGKPDVPFNCTLLNQTTESLEVECVEGFDGGQPQYFLLEVFDLQTGILQANISSKFPMFTVSGLGAGMELKMLIYSANSKGRSESTTVEGFTLKAAEKQTGTPVPFELTPILGILIGVVTVLLVVAMVIVGALRVRAQQRSGPARPGNLTIKEKVALPLRSDVEDLYQTDDKNPDVIPCNKDSDYQLVSGAQTPGLNNQTTPQEVVYEDHPKRNNVGQRNGDLLENFKNNRDRYPAHPASEEVTYAELCLVRPTNLQDPKMPPAPLGNGGVRGRDEPTIYAQIDHSRRPPPRSPGDATLSPLSPLVSPMAHLPGNLMHREIVTVRTPLMANQQESCV